SENSILPFSETLEYIFKGYWKERGDPRVETWFFMQSFAPPFTILLVWSVFVKYLGPRWMEHRKPFSLKTTLLLYNLVMSLSNGYFLVRFFTLYHYGMDMFRIQFPSFDQPDARTASIMSHNHLYTLSKFVDLLDTVCLSFQRICLNTHRFVV